MGGLSCLRKWNEKGPCKRGVDHSWDWEVRLAVGSDSMAWACWSSDGVPRRKSGTEGCDLVGEVLSVCWKREVGRDSVCVHIPPFSNISAKICSSVHAFDDLEVRMRES